MRLSWETIARFWSKVAVGTKKVCWPWVGSKDQHGYGQINVKGRPIKASRVALLLSGKNLGKSCALHRCDNPACCNPRHLFVGTKAQNSRDMIAKGRSIVGTRNARHKLTEEDVRTIRRESKKGRTNKEIARGFLVHRMTVSRIVRGKNWRHV